MNSTLLSLFSIFAGPLGGLVNKGITVASTAAITWLVARGLPVTGAEGIVSGALLVVSSVATIVTKTDTSKIFTINRGANGVVVVPAIAAARNGIAPVNQPIETSPSSVGG